MVVETRDDRARFGASARNKSRRIALEHREIGRHWADFVLVDGSLCEFRHKKVPKRPTGRDCASGGSAVPLIEVSNYANALGVRRPHGELHARDSQNRGGMRPHFFVFQVMRPLAHQMQIVIGQQRGKGIRIIKLADCLPASLTRQR